MAPYKRLLRNTYRIQIAYITSCFITLCVNWLITDCIVWYDSSQITQNILMASCLLFTTKGGGSFCNTCHTRDELFTLHPHVVWRFQCQYKSFIYFWQTCERIIILELLCYQWCSYNRHLDVVYIRNYLHIYFMFKVWLGSTGSIYCNFQSVQGWVNNLIRITE